MHWPHLPPTGRPAAQWVPATDGCWTCVAVAAQQPGDAALQERRQVRIATQQWLISVKQEPVRNEQWQVRVQLTQQPRSLNIWQLCQ